MWMQPWSGSRGLLIVRPLARSRTSSPRPRSRASTFWRRVLRARASWMLVSSPGPFVIAWSLGLRGCCAQNAGEQVGCAGDVLTAGNSLGPGPPERRALDVDLFGEY